MVRVENIAIKDGEVSFAYFPENDNIEHFFRYDTNKKIIIEHLKSKVYPAETYSKHALVYVLALMRDKKEIPKYQIIHWY